MNILKIGKQILYYGFFGFLATIVDYGLFLLLYYFNMHYLLASLISAIVGNKNTPETSPLNEILLITL